MENMQSNLWHLIPKVDELLESAPMKELAGSKPRPLLLLAIRTVLDQLRDEIARGKWNEKHLEKNVSANMLAVKVRHVLENMEAFHPPRAVNATGVVLHTGLGRAPLSAKAIQAMQEAAGYCMLEIDQATGKRGQRDYYVEKILKSLLGCEAAAAVNNNAAATLLVVHTLAKGKQVLVSRGELVEIGGSYRMPDVMQAGSAKLVEVGTTNRTRLQDYADAMNKKVGLILKVHTSNYKMQGFTEDVALQALSQLGREHQVPVAHDLGSGLLLQSEIQGLQDEPRVIASLRAGVDVVTFSADKLLGGPQAGLLLGNQQTLNKIRKNPMFRAMRLGKQSLAALAATLSAYLSGEQTALQAIPILRMLCMQRAAIEQQARSLLQKLQALQKENFDLALEENVTQVGSGSAPGIDLPSMVVAVSHKKYKVEQFAKRLRLFTPPIFARIHEDKVLLDPRTLLEGDEDAVVRAFAQIA